LQRDASIALGSSGMTLMELTSAFAGVSANQYPVKARAFVGEEEGWFEWLLSGQRSFGSTVHGALLELLAATVNDGTGRAARLSVPAYGKTGTSQDNRDALFIGFAGDLIVGVWVGNDDNTPLKNVTGGGLPARIWRDFMSQAVKGAGPRPKPKPAPTVDPETPIEPLDLPEIPELPIDIREPDVRIDPDNGVTVSGEVEGVPIDLRIDRDGIDVRSGEDRGRR
jgi:penicillin-binding protein 1A